MFVWTINTIYSEANWQEHSFIAGRNLKWYSPLGDSLSLSYKIKQNLMIEPRNCTPRYLNELGSLCPDRNLHKKKYDFSSFIHNCQKLEATFKRWMHKQTVVYPHNGILLRKMNEFLNLEMTWKNLKCLSLNELRGMSRLSTVWFWPYDILGKQTLETEGRLVTARGKEEGREHE